VQKVVVKLQRSDIQGSYNCSKGVLARQQFTANVYGKILIIALGTTSSQSKRKKAA